MGFMTGRHCVAAACAALSLTLVATPLLAQDYCAGNVMCTGMGSSRNCTAMVTTSNLSSVQFRGMSGAVTCMQSLSGTMAMFTAMRTTAGPAPASCSFYLYGGINQPCIIDAADGLPVEMMDFSIEPSDEERSGKPLGSALDHALFGSVDARGLSQIRLCKTARLLSFKTATSPW
jgi:hypothetical protein